MDAHYLNDSASSSASKIANSKRIACLLTAAAPNAAEAVLSKLPAEMATAIRAEMENQRPDQAFHDEQIQETHTAFPLDRLAFLNDVPQSVLFRALLRERPQTVAILLSVLPPDYAPRVIRTLSPDRKSDVLTRLSRMPAVPQSVVDTLLIGLKQRIEKVCTNAPSRADGVQRVVNILKACDRDTETTIVSSLGQHDRILTGEIQQMLFTFNNIAMLDDEQIQTLTKNVHAETWAMAFKRADANVRDRVLENLSTRAAQQVHAEMNYLGHASPSEIDRAQQQIVNVARQLQDQPTIRRAA